MNTESHTFDAEDYLELAEVIRRLYHNKAVHDFKKGTSKVISNDDPPTFRTPSIDEVKELLGRKWNARLKQLLVLCYQFKDQSDPVIYIAQASKHWRDCFHSSQSTISRVLKAAVKVGLLVVKWQGDRFDHTPTDYWMNHDMKEALIEWCELNGITISKEGLRLSLQEQVEAIESAKVRQGYINKVEKPFQVVPFKGGRLPNLTDKEVVYGLYESRPQYLALLNTLKEINEYLPEDEHHRLSPTIRRDKNGHVISIGLRATNTYCNTKKEKDGNAGFMGVYREDVLKKKLGTWTEYDIKASIPSISLLMTTGRWREDTEDLYEAIRKEPFQNEAQRKLFKGMFLPVYFNKSTNQLISHIKRQATKTHYQFSEEETMEMWNQAAVAMANVDDTIGRLGTEVFLHESCICANAMLRMLKEEGWRVIEIYDGFYIQTDGSQYDAGRKEQRAAQIIREEAESYYQKWNRWMMYYGVKEAV